MTATDRLLLALEEHGCQPRQLNGAWQARCPVPAHEDSTPSLSARGVEGRALVYCHAGCATPDVVDALDLKLRDLFDDPKGATYRYADGRTVRRAADEKRFWQRNVPKDKPACLYRLGEVKAAVAAGQTVYVAEGENDVHALESAGVVATCCPGGGKQWGKVDSSPLYDAARVVIVADRDATGAKHASDVLVSLKEHVAEIEVVQARSGKDAADHLTAGHGLDEFEPSPTPGESRATVPPQAPDLATAPRILDLLARDMVALGVVGERVVVASAYLVITSRLLERQASLAVKGESASGKSYAVAAVVRLFPPEAVVVFTGMSERALVYSEEQYSHRTIVMYEAVALRERAEKDHDNQTSMFVRTLLSEGRIDYEVTVKGKDGAFTTKKIVKQGPTNLIVTTTQVNIHAENETRMLSITTDDSRAQTARVLAALADESASDIDVERWHQLQLWLAEHGEHRVTVPYAARLAELVPPVAVRLRRDFGALLALIRAHAVLHQLNRDRDDRGQVVANLDDYEVVRGIVGDILSEGVAATVPEVVRQTVEAVAKLDIGLDGVQATALAEHLQLDRSAARRRLLRAAAGGYVQNLEERRGRPGRWRAAAPLPDDVGLLPPCHLLATAEAQENWGTERGGGTVARAHQGGESPTHCRTCGNKLLLRNGRDQCERCRLHTRPSDGERS